MLPSLVARDIEKGLRSYIRNEFPIASKGFCDESGKTVVERFLEAPGSLAKGPWIEVRMPFRQEAGGPLPFTALDAPRVIPGFTPYAHQRKAFERLAGDAPKSTLIATGTGSGKTECFLLPILDYCLSMGKRPGVKAILIYPMNALATDQEKRVKELTERIAALTGHEIRAGLYTGDTPDDVRREYQRVPPDILLTNYKMLDLLLLRPEDQKLWTANAPGVLRYLAVDELHTFDGAQGTDLACLIRRLRDRLKIDDSLACIGTSATIGGSPESLDDLCRYASSVFGTRFDRNAVILEDRLSPKEYLESLGDLPPRGHWPEDPGYIRAGLEAASAGDYFSQILPYWFDETLGFYDTKDGIPDEVRVQLGKALPALEGFRRLVCDARGVASLDDLARQWAREIPDFREAAPDPLECEELARACAESLIAMVSEARVEAQVINADGSERAILRPLLAVRTQLWIRTLSRAVATVEAVPRMALADDLPSLTRPLALPLVACRDCGQAGWAASLPGGPDKAGASVKPDLKQFYNAWFSCHRDTAVIYPVTDPETYEANRTRAYRLCPDCGELQSVMNHSWEALPPAGSDEARCRRCESRRTLIVWIPDMTGIENESEQKRIIFKNRCPCCGAAGGLRIFGAAAATLLAAAADHLHSSCYSGDSKILAFSDSVQDAAQRAGFLEARDYLPVCRHALVQYLKGRGSGATPLPTLITSFSRACAEAAAAPYQGEPDAGVKGKAAFLATYMPPDKEWMHRWEVFSQAAEASFGLRKDGRRITDVEALKKTLPDWEPLVEDARQRLTWEALMELGARSENGRTTLRTGHCAAFPDPARITAAARRLVPALRDEHGITVTEERARHFLAGLLHRFQLSGAFDATGFSKLGAKPLEDDFGAFEAGIKNDYQAFNKSWVLPTFGQRYRAPNAVTLTPDREDKFNISATGRARTWFEQWTEKLLARQDLRESAALQADFDTQDVLREAFKALTDAKLLRVLERPRKAGAVPAWVMPLAPWSVAQDVRVWRCRCCGRRFFTAGGATALLWQSMPCLTPSCPGELEESPAADSLHYYDSDPVRINAEEHTSLVDPEKRLAIEKSFGTVPEPWSVNLLSATPTLEMGIDIGSLSSVVLCSVPPGQSSYLQRIGRAGRRDGNAFALTLAGKSPHERYYWQDPAEMLTGRIEPPGVFLHATSVLERQLFAFALGRWVLEASPQPVLPRSLKDAINAFSGSKSETRFPKTFLAWTAQNAPRLTAAFFALFDRKGEPEELTAAVREGLSRLLDADEPAGRSLAARLSRSLTEARNQREALQRKKKEVDKRVFQLQKGPVDEAVQNEIETLEDQKNSILALLKSSFDAKLFFNFLTDEGLLPNYAFPEEGVQVHSIIVKRPRRDEDVPRKSRAAAFDFTRAAGPALKELAPESSFYASRYRLQVDQLAVTDESFERWRFCQECGHAELASLNAAPGPCPHCGHPLFGDSGRVKTLIRTRELTARADAQLDRISDDREERRREPTASHLLIDVDQNDVQAAWQVKDGNFGFEFLRRVTVREINFGPSIPGAAAPFRAGGIDFPQFGFKICRHCGKVWRRNSKDKQRHDIGCPCYGQPEDPEKSPWQDGLFLYREVRSEAIRIRIPVCDMIDGDGADTGTSSLIAAIQLGLKRFFHGSVDHLKIALQTEPAGPESAATNRFIVIYDSIPGGSGYLKELGSPERMMAMLREALSAVANCECAKDPEKDGCPHCVYQYRDFSPRERISRREAEKLLRRICGARRDDIQTTATVSLIPAFDRSVLEELFVQRLAALKASVPEATFTAVPGDAGDERYEICLPLTASAREAFRARTGADPGPRFTWRLRSQVDYESATWRSRPDFLIEPASEKLASRYPELLSYVFTDGWEFHASIIAEDAEKRQCIANDGHRVWSIAWQDLAARKAGEPRPAGHAQHLCSPQLLPHALVPWKRLGRTEDGAAAARRLLLSGSTNFDWLTAWMLDPFGFSSDMRTAVEFTALSQPPIKVKAGDPRIPAPLSAQLFPGQQHIFCSDFKNRADFDLACCLLEDKPKHFLVTGAIRLDNAPFLEDSAAARSSSSPLHALWAAFWQCANAIQFLERGWFCTSDNERAAPYEAWFSPRQAAPCAASAPLDAEADARWREAMEELEDDAEFFQNVIPLALALRQAGAPAPEVGEDGYGDTVCCEPLGLSWEGADGRQAFLFPAEHLFHGIDSFDDGRKAVFTTADPQWLSKLCAVLADMEKNA